MNYLAYAKKAIYAFVIAAVGALALPVKSGHVTSADLTAAAVAGAVAAAGVFGLTNGPHPVKDYDDNIPEGEASPGTTPSA